MTCTSSTAPNEVGCVWYQIPSGIRLYGLASRESESNCNKVMG
jgi:hypothetical protein